MATADQARQKRSRRRSEPRTDRDGAVADLPAAAGERSLPGVPWHRSTFALGLAGGLLLWAAFPPLACWPLAWIAPLCWLALIDRPVLPGRRPYLVLWVAGLVHWLLLLQGIRLAHWATYFGWVALSVYLAVYLPLFVGLSRLAVRRFRWPIMLAAPVVWTALELVRGHLLTGFSLGMLGHTQVAVLPVIQFADVAGAYGVSFLVMLVAACLWKTLAADCRWKAWAAAAVAVASLAAVVGYGLVRMTTAPSAAGDTIRVALIQSSAETVFEYDPQRNREIFHDYRELSLQAARRRPDLDLILWPESVYTANVRELLVESDAKPPAMLQMKPREFERAVEQWRLAFEAKNALLAEEINTAAGNRPQQRGRISLLVGTDVERIREEGTDLYNTAMLLNPQGRVVGRYFKMHPVMFGEYVPLGDWFPWLYDLTPLGQGLSAGKQPQCFEVGQVRLAPSICFECTVPQLIRRQLVELRRRGTPPDVLVSVTNDGWFHGSAILDLHLACAIFRAVEHRRPMLIAANTGISAHVNSRGEVEQRVPPLSEGYLVCEVGRAGSDAWYTRLGDLPALLCLLLTVSLVGWAGWQRMRGWRPAASVG